MQVRLVVTGHNAKGRSVFVHDQQVDAMPIPGLGEPAMLWSADEPATYPNAGDDPQAPGIFPALGGVRFVMATYSPEYDVSAPENVARRHVQEGDEPGFHRPDTTDSLGLISRKLAVQLDYPAPAVLQPGDVFIDN